MEIIYLDTREFDKSELQDLFLSVNWSSAKYPDRLQKAMLNSHSVLSAWDGGKLVGLMNCLSDGYMAAYFHYLLVRPEYQGKGIGKRLAAMMLERYEGFPSRFLISYNDQVGFYESCGFITGGNTTPVYVKAPDMD